VQPRIKAAPSLLLGCRRPSSYFHIAEGHSPSLPARCSSEPWTEYSQEYYFGSSHGGSGGRGEKRGEKEVLDSGKRWKEKQRQTKAERAKQRSRSRPVSFAPVLWLPRSCEGRQPSPERKGGGSWNPAFSAATGHRGAALRPPPPPSALGFPSGPFFLVMYRPVPFLPCINHSLFPNL
jgi:hypothetical protein